MGRVFLIEKEGPVFTCSTCGIQIAHHDNYEDYLMNMYEFFEAYNVNIGEDTTLYYGYEVSCVNCCNLLGWRELEKDGRLFPFFRFKQDCVVPPLPPANPPPPENPPLPPEDPPLPPESPPPLPLEPPPEDPPLPPESPPPLPLEPPPEDLPLPPESPPPLPLEPPPEDPPLPPESPPPPEVQS